MSIAPFSSDADLLKFAKWFFCNRLETFRKDIDICMTPKRGEHAYFPALIICIAFADLLSGLHAGKLWPRLQDLKRYAAKFIRHPEYTPYHLNLLYECLRHKVAHLAYPYAVFATANSKIFKGQQRHYLVTWRINASDRRPAIELVKYTSTRTLAKDRTPWRVPYDARIKVRVRRFHMDIIKSIGGPRGYLKHLESNAAARENFAAFMREYYPP